ncbi:unnamed protein product [Tilletia controversa]|uniref:Uncharacterized protein n=2 Tax=Tilletia TaxID=13289 RepID=A0A177UH05_9BASI|nr:hypothetical protein CF336_g3099 [Tilletia laevis]KAE8261961.1 hypothetical protein A4X03_0g2829 [Tilletia caries]CAD6920134.1 unnamed protein product [Tilletia controversa]CAD6887946.1 unnamed protein product [Tilletia caries]CAD6919928.1 unnamed protein product [Tilletia laevis]
MFSIFEMNRISPVLERSERDRGCAPDDRRLPQHSRPAVKRACEPSAPGSFYSASAASSSGSFDTAEDAQIFRAVRSTTRLTSISQTTLLKDYHSGVVAEPESIVKHALSSNRMASRSASEGLGRTSSLSQRMHLRARTQVTLTEGAEASFRSGIRKPSLPIISSTTTATTAIFAAFPNSDPNLSGPRPSLDDVKAAARLMRSRTSPFAQHMTTDTVNRPFADSTPINASTCESSLAQRGVKATTPRVVFKVPAPSGPAPNTLGASRVWPQDDLAMKLVWPQDIPGYNRPQNQDSEGSQRQNKKKKSKSSLRKGSRDQLASFCSDSDGRSASLLHYRNFNDGDASSEANAEEGKGTRSTSKGRKGATGKPVKLEPVLFCSSCQAPAWSTGSLRYEAPVQVMYGDTLETPVWEAFTPDMIGQVRDTRRKKVERKKGEEWYLRHLRSGFTTRLKSEDINNNEWSITDREGRNWLMRTSSAEKVLSVVEKGRATRCGTYDPIDQILYVELRPARTSFRDPNASPMDVAFVLCCFEAIQAIRDEQASGGGKGRRDECGRLIPKSDAAFKNLIQRLMGL